MMTMKKTYQKPEVKAVRVQHTRMLCNSPVTNISSNANINYGGGSNTEAARVKQNDYNVWNDDWNK